MPPIPTHSDATGEPSGRPLREGFLTSQEVAELLRISRDTVYRLAARGELPGRRVGRIWRFPVDAMREHVRTGGRPVPESVPGTHEIGSDSPTKQPERASKGRATLHDGRRRHDVKCFANAALNALTSHIAIIERDGRIIATNDAWCRFAADNSACADAVNIGANYLDVCARAKGESADGADVVAQGIRSVLAGTRDEFSQEYPCHSPTRRRWFVVRVTRLSNEGPAQAVIAHEDITERKVAELALLEQKKLLDYIITNIPHTVFWKDRNSVYLGCNAQFAQRAGLGDTAEIIGKTDFDLPWTKEEAEWYRTCDRQVMESGRAMADIEETQERADGTNTTILTSKVPIRDQAGDVSGVLGIYADITALKQAEDRLRDAKDYVHSVFESMIEMLVVVAPDGTIRTTNAATCKMLGYREEELLGRPVGKLFCEEEEEPTNNLKSQESLPFGRTVLRRLVTEGAIRNIEKTLRTASGRTIPALVSGSVMRNKNGTIHGILCVGQDIADRKRLEAEMLQVNHDLLAVNRIHEALFSCQTTLDVASALVASLVREFGAYFARVWLVGPGDSCSECALSRQCRDNRRCLHLVASAGQYTHIDGDHRRVPLGAFKIGLIAQGRGKTVSNDVVNDECVHDRAWAARHGLQSFAGLPLIRDGEVIGVMAMFSRSMLPEHELDTLELLAHVGSAALTGVGKTETLRKLSLAVEQTPASIMITDTHGTIEYVNRWFTEVTGYAAQEAVGQNPRILKSGNQSKRFYKRLWETIIAGNVWTGAFENRRKNGHPFWEEASISPIRDANGTVTHFLAVKQDITKRKKVEEALRNTQGELRKHRDHLEELVEQRTRELQRTNNSLRLEIKNREKAEIAAEKANRAKGDFLARMSHELRTPLNGVIGMMELLLRSDLDEKQRRHAWLAKTSGDTLLTLINDILDFSKIEAGKLELENTDLDLRHIVESLGASLASRAHAKGLELICSVHPQVPSLVRGDPARLQQILLNLLSNAIKFTEHGEVVVRATSDGETERDVTVRVTVTDTGIGIPPDRRETLFQSFSQLDASTTRKYGGTGLGLAICSQLVELMGGTIGVESEPGRGSTFWFTVRLQRQQTGDPQPRSLGDDLRSIRILAVDDNPTNREILSEQLGSVGFKHDTASSGEEALIKLRAAAARNTPFGLAILDMQLPGINGEQLAQAIRSERPLEDTVLLLLTSGDNGKDPDRLRLLGFSGWLTKPVGQSQLVDTIVETLACAVAAPRTSQQQLFDECSSRTHDGWTARSSGARILLAEDNEINAEAATELLAQAGYNCTRVTNGKDTVQAVLAGEYDLILMDCQMPEMDGFEATRVIRRHENDGTLARERRGRIPIIALTANAIKGDRERCIESGMDDYLTKPIDPRWMVEVIEKHLAPAGEESSASQAGVPEGSLAEAEPADSSAERHALETSSPFDLDALYKRWGTNEDFAEKLIAKFRNQAPGDLEKLEQAFAAGDMDEATRLAHGLKGAASYVAAEALRGIAARLEEMARTGDLTDAEVCLKELRAGLKRCLSPDPNREADVEPQRAHTDR